MSVESERAAIERVAAGLTIAWNKADGAEFASYFDEDADFVTIHGLHVAGRQKIAESHDMIFRTIYAGSAVHYAVSKLRFLHDGLALAHVTATLDAPTGPLAGRNTAVPSLILRRTAKGWSIMALHNTLVQTQTTKQP